MWLSLNCWGLRACSRVRLLTALLGALLFGGVGLLEDLARIRSRSVLGLRRYTRLGLEAAAGAVVLVLLGAKGCLAAGITLPGVGYIDLGIAAPLLWEGLLVALPSAPALPMAWTASSAVHPLRPCWA